LRRHPPRRRANAGSHFTGQAGGYVALSCRAPVHNFRSYLQADLLGDIDAWGIAELREQQATRLDTIEKLLTTYYGDLTPSGTPGRKLTNRRQNAIENFLRAYGFEFDYAKHQYPRTLTGQKASFEHMKEQIRLFTRVWIVYRKKVMDREIVVDPGVLDGMTTYFLRWLERQAIENGAVTK
jgi:hypothetical protein